MTNITSNQDYLVNQQYKDASNLNARIQLHERFGTDKYGWQRWVFDHIQMPQHGHILELGTGPARLWLENLDRIPADWQLILSDLSPGMLREAQHNLQNSQRQFTFQVIDAQSIPLPDNSLDAVVANHMIYHIPGKAKAFAEISRVLKPGGYLYAATNGDKHLYKIHELMSSINTHAPSIPEVVRPFSLENGTAQLAPFFRHVSLEKREDELVVTEAEPLIAYMLSGFRFVDQQVGEQEKLALIEKVERELAQGPIRIERISGLFVAQK